MRPVFEALGDVGIAPEGHTEVAVPLPPADELVERVKRRAADILRARDVA
jgi:hypothetical protein